MNNYKNYNWYSNYQRNNNYLNGMNIKESQDLYSPKEGFEKGNMFANLYSSYKNYKPKPLQPKTEQERMLYNLQAITFASHELNLYLDLHPEDQSMVTLFNDYRRQKEQLTKEYESKFGPMTVGSDTMENQTFEWANSPWPWEVDNV